MVYYTNPDRYQRTYVDRPQTLTGVGASAPTAARDTGRPAKPTAARVTERPEIQAGVGARGDARKALLFKGFKAAGKPYFSRVSGPCLGNPRHIRASGSF
uniref:Uncharacterized protein n=1 Tax=uncultured marine virus TaxID=186617 RepID=A0A0F7L252_9VIRU|nr:hypothetical protein [uncultured marine virus]